MEGREIEVIGERKSVKGGRNTNRRSQLSVQWAAHGG